MHLHTIVARKARAHVLHTHRRFFQFASIKLATVATMRSKSRDIYHCPDSARWKRLFLLTARNLDENNAWNASRVFIHLSAHIIGKLYFIIERRYLFPWWIFLYRALFNVTELNAKVRKSRIGENFFRNALKVVRSSSDKFFAISLAGGNEREIVTIRCWLLHPLAALLLSCSSPPTLFLINGCRVLIVQLT